MSELATLPAFTNSEICILKKAVDLKPSSAVRHFIGVSANNGAQMTLSRQRKRRDESLKVLGACAIV